MVSCRYSILVVFFLLASFSQLKSQHADCDNPVVLKDTIFQSPAISGFGDVKEFDGYELENKKFFESEEHSIWYLITIPADGLFTFDIKTHSITDDWDFLLFEHKTMFCKRIADKKIAPIRSNLSRSPVTGLSKKGMQAFVGAGVNSNYSKPLQVTKGDKYVLVVNNPKQAGKQHTLVLHLPKLKPQKQKVAPKKRTIETMLFKLSIKDAVTKKHVPSSVIISGLKKNTIELDTITNYEAEVIKANHDVNLTVSAKGYMLTAKELEISKMKSTHSAQVYLERIKAGQKVNLRKIQFYGNRADFLPSARSSLKALLQFMKQNPTVVIEIEGHVNGPGQRNSNRYKDLSLARANAVKDYLIQNKIEAARLKFKGYGNSQMLFPAPKNEKQQSANRRVEIKIISNGTNSGN